MRINQVSTFRGEDQCKKIMDSKIYEEVKDLAIKLVNASEVDDTQEYWSLYNQLEEICSKNENGENNHPFQWETLGDFTSDNTAALEIYKKSLALAEELKLNEYIASVTFAMAERYGELGENKMAIQTARQANKVAENLDDLELRREISEFLLNECT